VRLSIGSKPNCNFGQPEYRTRFASNITVDKKRTDNAVLDKITIDTFERWRFKPGRADHMMSSSGLTMTLAV
jgi:hypothetical protein